MQRPVQRAARPSTRTQLPSLPKFPEEGAKESILKLSDAFEQRGSGGKPTEKRKPFEEILEVATEGMLVTVRKSIPL
jgi:hypothetical protein